MGSLSLRTDAEFVAVLDKGCREFANRDVYCSAVSSKIAELLAICYGTLLRKSIELSEEAKV
jgi:hypothetical protein